MEVRPQLVTAKSKKASPFQILLYPDAYFAMSAWACGLHFAVGIPCSLNRNGKGRFLLYTSPQPYMRSWIGEQLQFGTPETNMMPRTLFHEEHPIDAVVRIVAQCAILCTNSCSLVDDFHHGWVPRAQMHAVHMGGQ
jgi:hypothetical protein